jgi:hypothetical protein
MGIGERRAEGFGRVAVNWHTEAELEMEELEEEELEEDLTLPSRTIRLYRFRRVRTASGC